MSGYTHRAGWTNTLSEKRSRRMGGLELLWCVCVSLFVCVRGSSVLPTKHWKKSWCLWSDYSNQNTERSPAFSSQKNPDLLLVKLARKAGLPWGQAGREWWIKGNLSGARGAKVRGVVFLSHQAAGILSYRAYICESCWCNCIEVLATICSPLGGPGSSCRQWSGYVQHITAADVLTEKKNFLFRFSQRLLIKSRC